MYSINRKPPPTPDSSSRTLVSQSSIGNSEQDTRLRALQAQSSRSRLSFDDVSDIASTVPTPRSHPQRLGLPGIEIDTNVPEIHKYFSAGWPRHPNVSLPKHQFELISEGLENYSLLRTEVQRKKYYSPNFALTGFRRALHRCSRHLGWWKTCIAILGTSSILLLLCWVLFLWHNTSQTVNCFWRWIVLNDYLNITVTVSSALLRIIIAAQGAVATAMIASVILENFKSKLCKSAALSVLRAWGNSPGDLITSWSFSTEAWPMIICTVVLVITTLISQLTSTLLVSDLIPAIIQGNPQMSDTKYGLGWDQAYVLIKPDYSLLGPSSFPTFAEFRNSSNLETNAGIDDTGAVIRAVLPISSALTRQSIARYTGFATLINPRVICMPPKVISASFTFKSWLEYTGKAIAPYIQGSMSMGDLRPVGLDTQSPWDPQPMNYSAEFLFNCVLQETTIPTEWPLGLCIPDFGDGQDIAPPFLQIESPFVSSKWLPEAYIMANYSGEWPIALGISSVNVSDSFINESAPIITDWVYSKSSPSSHWTNLNSPSNPGFEINLSFCLTSFQAAEANITAAGETNRTEPSLDSFKVQGLNATIDSQNGDGSQNISYLFNTSSVLQQLGADGVSSTYGERGIMSLHPQSPWAELRYSEGSGGPRADNYTDSTTAVLDGSFGFNEMTIQDNTDPRSNSTWGLCSYCGLSESNESSDLNFKTKSINIKLAAIFQAALLQSNSPATALQALFTVVNFMQYYDRVAHFQISNISEMTFFETHLQPVYHRGLTIIAVISTVHLAFFFLVSALFLGGTRLSILGNTWSAISQMNVEIAQRLYEVSTLSSQAEVEKWTKENGLGGMMVQLVEHDGGQERKIARLEKVS